MILDTSFVIDVLRGDPDALERHRRLEGQTDRQRLSAMSVFELFEGVERSLDSLTERQAVLDILERKSVLPADGLIMRTAGRMYGRTVNRGRPVGESDCVIAATARAHDEPVLTRNVDDFEQFEDVEVRAY